MNTVPAMTIRSASRGVPRITSAPKRAMSYLLVMLVAISTKQQERPKLKGQMEFLRPQASRSCSRVSRKLRSGGSGVGVMRDLPAEVGVTTSEQPGPALQLEGARPPQVDQRGQ